jgi:hypothetical protein
MRFATPCAGLLMWIAAPAALAAAPVSARHGRLPTGAGMRVEAGTGGYRVHYRDGDEARAACLAAGGRFRIAYGERVCANPRTVLRGVAISISPPRRPRRPRR